MDWEANPRLFSHAIMLVMAHALEDDCDLYSSLVRLHVLHHAAEEPNFGLGMIEELARHGYRISPGSLYPRLHGLELKGYLRAPRT